MSVEDALVVAAQCCFYFFAFHTVFLAIIRIWQLTYLELASALLNNAWAR